MLYETFVLTEINQVRIDLNHFRLILKSKQVYKVNPSVFSGDFALKYVLYFLKTDCSRSVVI